MSGTTDWTRSKPEPPANELGMFVFSLLAVVVTAVIGTKLLEKTVLGSEERSGS